MKDSNSRFRELLSIARSWNNFDFKLFRKYLDAKSKWRVKMN